jgi:PhzF family phenazine biosynthesis protein
MNRYRFKQVDVFTDQPTQGNPLAVVLGADALSDAQMAAFANWTNLSETTFVLKPSAPEADYRVRIFTTQGELPFAGHPTLGSCHGWLENGGQPKGQDIIQECAVGLVRIRRDGARLAFAAPPLLRSGELEPALLERVCRGLGLTPAQVRASQWVDNGPGWLALLLNSRAEVLALQPDYSQLEGLMVGVVGPWQPEDGDEADFELRAFVAGEGMPEDPVTGSLNASVAQWLIGAGIAPSSYRASQGTVLGRRGRVQIAQQGADIWVGGQVLSCIEGSLTL